jgi:hypothetical protein
MPYWIWLGVTALEQLLVALELRKAVTAPPWWWYILEFDYYFIFMRCSLDARPSLQDRILSLVLPWLAYQLI